MMRILLMPGLVNVKTYFLMLYLLFVCFDFNAGVSTRYYEVSQFCDTHHIMNRKLNYLFHSYNKNILPNKNGVVVSVELHIQDISTISEVHSDFKLDLLFSEVWQDSRLSFNNGTLCTSNLTLKSYTKDFLWTPEVSIVNSKASRIHHSPSENTFVILYRNGTVWLNHRMAVRAPCRIDLRYLPFDTQHCFLAFESYSYNSQEVQLDWMHDAISAITFMKKINMPEFYLHHWKARKKRFQYPNGQWDHLELSFTFKRRYGFYFAQAYFPTTLTVLASWTSFYLEARSTSARITLGVSSLLALTFQFGSVLGHLPRVSYVKCIDVWMIGCVVFVFLTLVETAVISRVSKSQRMTTHGKNALGEWLQMIRRKRRTNAAAVGGHHTRKKDLRKLLQPEPIPPMVAKPAKKPTLSQSRKCGVSFVMPQYCYANKATESNGDSRQRNRERGKREKGES